MRKRDGKKQQILPTLREGKCTGGGQEKQPDVSDSFPIENPMLCDRLHTLSAEYSMPVGTLVNLAAKRLVEDVDFVRGLRTGRIKTK